MKKAIPLWSGLAYRRWCWLWWKGLGRWILSGWIFDISQYWHRARYGFASRDTWSLDHYVAGALGGALSHLAEHCHGAPAGYPNDGVTSDGESDCDTNFEQWEADLRRWAKAFADYAKDDYYKLHRGADGKTNYAAWQADEKQRFENALTAWREIGPWFGSLWD